MEKPPDGWVLVPREPTEAMLQAGIDAPQDGDVWQAMIDAAPALAHCVSEQVSNDNWAAKRLAKVERDYQVLVRAFDEMLSETHHRNSGEATRLRAALRELHAAVRGECPRLLNEDSGGDARLAVEIEQLLAEETA